MATEAFVSSVRGTDGTWPGPPSWFSYSALIELEACPRRWMLRRARFPQVWDRHGYPDPPSLPALAGEVTHAGLEAIVRALVNEQCEGPNTPCAVGTLKKLGGYTTVLSMAIERVLAPLKDNPRAVDRLPAIERALRLRLPEMRHHAQTTIARSAMVPKVSSELGESHVKGRAPLARGSHAEVDLRAPALKWTGRADLMNLDSGRCEIVDYKTGAPHDSHKDQLRIYALLWFHDEELNPSRQPATDLVVSYPARDEIVAAPDRGELLDLEATLRTRTEAALSELARRPPEARPEAELCSHCPVRQLCDPYWDHLEEMAAKEARDHFQDAEVQVTARNGPRSWVAKVSKGLGSSRTDKAVLQTPAEDVPFEAGDALRLVNIAVSREEENNLVTLTITPNSETFVLARPSR